MDGSNRDLRASRVTKLVMTSVLLGSMLLFGSRRGQGATANLSPLQVVLLGLSSYRTGRIVAFERIAEPLRAPFTSTVPDDSGAGETVVARGKGVRWSFGELLSCPICVATWAAAGQLYALDIMPGVTRVYLSVMGAAGIAELAYGLSETLSWFGHAKRAEVGARLRDREKARWSRLAAEDTTGEALR